MNLSTNKQKLPPTTTICHFENGDDKLAIPSPFVFCFPENVSGYDVKRFEYVVAPIGDAEKVGLGIQNTTKGETDMDVFLIVEDGDTSLRTHDVAAVITKATEAAGNAVPAATLEGYHSLGTYSEIMTSEEIRPEVAAKIAEITGGDAIEVESSLIDILYVLSEYTTN